MLVGDGDSLDRFPLPLLRPTLLRPPLLRPTLLLPLDRKEVVEEVAEGDLEDWSLVEVGDPRPLPLVVEAFLLDLDRDRRLDERDRDRDRDRDLDLDLDRFWRVWVCRRVLLEGRLPYLRPLVLVCCDCSLEAVGESLDAESVVVVGVLEEVFGSLCPPGESGGVELVTGVNTVSLLTFTSQCPVALYLRASSANNT